MVLKGFIENFGPLVEIVCLILLTVLGACLFCRGLVRAYRCLKAQLGGVEPLTRVVLLALCVSFAPFAASKFAGGVNRAGAPSSSSPPRLVSSSSAPLSSSSELAISDFALTPSSAVFGVSLPFGALTSDSLVWILARTNLVVGAWEPLWRVAPETDAQSLEIEIPFADLPGVADGTPPSSAFFAAEAQVLADTDRDGVPDLDETGGIGFGADLPDFDFAQAAESVTLFDAATDSWYGDRPPVPLPFTVWCGGVPSTNAVMLSNGVVCFLAAGHEDGWLRGGTMNADFAGDYFVYSFDHAVVAACWTDLYARRGSGAVLRAATFGWTPERWFVLEYADVSLSDRAWDDDPPRATFQIAVSEAAPSTAHVRYLSLSNGFDFAAATLGAQGPERRPNLPVAYNVAAAATNGMVVSYHFGFGSDPHASDTDGDGLDDAEEVRLGTNPARVDTDSDGIPDAWEVANGLDPLDPNDAALDPDVDSLSNLEEYLNQTNPSADGGYDSDGDGVDDGTEVRQGSDPNNSSDGGAAPPADDFRELVFNIGGDYAAWEMTIQGQGPDDMRTQIVTMGAPGAPQDVPKKLRKGNAYRLSMRWLNCDGHQDFQSPWYCWQALIDGLPTQKSFDDDYNDGFCVRIPQVNNIVVGSGWIAENEGGLLTSHVHASQRNAYDGPGAGNVAQGLVATLYVLDDPKLIPDYDRDGTIDDEDERTASDGSRVFRFWTNDDSDRSSMDGDTARAVADEFPVNGLDWDSGRVNGRRDLIDYAAILMDLKPVVDSVPGLVRSSLTFRLRQAEGALSAVWSTMEKDNLASFFKNDLPGFGSDLSQVSRAAEKERIGSVGLAVPDGFAVLAKAGGGQGVFWVDGRQPSTEPLWVEVLYDSRVICSNKLEMGISNVEDMYRWLNQRGVCGASVERASSLGEPANFPDRESDGGQFVFVHGYNVDERSARAWSAEMFKRLWQSGSRTMFTAATWYGNDSQSALYLGNTPDYYSNVDHALSTAASFSQSVAALLGAAKYVAAHSLGNMLVSSAIAEHGLSVTRYFMLNAAVPIEAYYPGAATETTRTNMTPADWRPYALRLRANHWHELFDVGDARRDLTRKGRFASINNAVNYYSTEEEVLANADGGDHTILSANFAWANQEMRKGVWPAFLPGNNEAGWSFNTAHDVVNTNYLNEGGSLMLRLTPVQANQLTDALLKQCPFFGAFDDMSICTTNLIEILPQKNQLLADAIPAESYAAGRNQIPGFVNLEMQGKRSGGGDWTHSFIVEAPYAWTYKVFDDIKERIR